MHHNDTHDGELAIYLEQLICAIASHLKDRSGQPAWPNDELPDGWQLQAIGEHRWALTRPGQHLTFATTNIAAAAARMLAETPRPGWDLTHTGTTLATAA